MTRAAWYAPLRGRCVACNTRKAVVRHHVVYEQHIEREHGDVWDVRNRLGLCLQCHDRHHSGFARVPMRCIPDEAITFAIELFGVAKAALYFSRYYNQRGGADASQRQRSLHL